LPQNLTHTISTRSEYRDMPQNLTHTISTRSE
jgi:hypothetical protein